MTYVYKIEENNEVVYIGETIHPDVRVYEHTQKRSGKFYKKDITFEVIAVFETKRQAYKYQIELQEQYGLVTDNEKTGFNSKNNRDAVVASRKGVDVSNLYGDKIAKTLQKLSYEEAESIRYKYKHTKTSMPKLSREYNVAPSTIYKIIHNKTYTTA